MYLPCASLGALLVLLASRLARSCDGVVVAVVASINGNSYPTVICESWEDDLFYTAVCAATGVRIPVLA